MFSAVVILLAALTMVLLSTVMGFVLGWANKAFHVYVDPRVEAINVALPGVNCGGCGYIGCNEFAEAMGLDQYLVGVANYVFERLNGI